MSTTAETYRGFTIILVRRGIDNILVPGPGLTYVEATAKQVTLAGRSVKIFTI
jgi:hypothetical protein